VAARQRLDGLVATPAFDREGADPRRRRGFLAGRTDQTPRAESLELGEREVFRDGEILREPLGFAVLGDETEALPPASAGAGGRRNVAVDTNLAGGRGIEAEESAEGLGAAGADEAGDADDLAAVERERGGLGKF